MWKPSGDSSVANKTWQAFETLFDDACPTAPLPRDDDRALDANYVLPRRHDECADISAYYSRLPRQYRPFRMGAAELDVLDVLINYKRDRVVHLVGTRGAGKTTLLHYIESVARRSQHPTYPVFLIVDYLQVSQLERLTFADFVKPLARELQQRADSPTFLPEGFPSAFEKAADALLRKPSTDGLRQAMLILRQELSATRARRIIVAIDNLDQFDSPVLALGLELARELYVGDNVACLVCLRPGSLRSALGRGDARAFANYAIHVSPPSTRDWIHSLHDRLPPALMRHTEHSDPPLVRSKPLTGARLQQIMLQLSNELELQRGPVDALRVLDAVAADDLRHVGRLVRRILSHRSFPETERKRDRFNPLVAMFEGQNTVFHGDDFVPGLLAHTMASGNVDYLLPLRLLTLLDGLGWVPTHTLLAWCETLGYSRPDAIACLDMLHRALLVSTSHSDKLESRTVPPQLQLTDAGAYYRRFLLRYPSYLTCAVMDVPLEHRLLFRHREAAVRTPPPFAALLDSLIEYSMEAIRAEEVQLGRLEQQTPSKSLWRVADSLHGGLLTELLVWALADIEAQVQHGTSRVLRDYLASQRHSLRELERRLLAARSRVDRLRMRAQPEVAPDDVVFRQHLGDTEFAIRQESRTEGSARIEIRSQEAPHELLVGLLGSETVHYVATVARPKRNVPDPVRPQEHNRSLVGYISSLPHSPGVQAVSIEQRADWGRLGFLAINRCDAELTLRLHVPLGTTMQTYDIGRTSVSTLIKWCAGELTDIGGKVLRGVDVEDHILETGTTLARLALSEPGQNVLAAAYDLIDTLVIFLADSELAIPWEWLRPERARSPSDVIGSRWRVIRWNADSFAGLYNLILARPSFGGDLQTYGLSERTGAWRRSIPASFRSIASSNGKQRIVHLVGHFAGPILELGRLQVRNETAIAFPLSDTCAIIASSCAAATTTSTSALGMNLPAELAKASNCTVWAPLVHIRLADADSLDRSLARHLAANTRNTIETFFGLRDGKLQRLYARYGVCAH